MLTAITMVRDEADVIEPVLRHLAAQGVDLIIVADNLSTDDTPNILARLQDELPLIVEQDDEPGYYQDVKMSRLARRAHEHGADWVLPFDADEVWYPADCPEHPKGGGAVFSSAFCPSYHGGVCPTGQTLGQFFAARTADIIEGRGWDHIARTGSTRTFSEWRRSHQQKLPKVAFRACPDPYVHMGNHSVDRNECNPVRAGGLLYRHFQYRSLEQYTRKVRNGKQAYDASDLHWNYGTHWRLDGALSDDDLAAKWAEMCAEEDLIYDPPPIQPEG